MIALKEVFDILGLNRERGCSSLNSSLPVCRKTFCGSTSEFLEHHTNSAHRWNLISTYDSWVFMSKKDCKNIMNFFRKLGVILRTQGYWKRCLGLSSSFALRLSYKPVLHLLIPSLFLPPFFSVSLFSFSWQSWEWCYHLSVMCPGRNSMCVCVFKAGWPGWAGNGAQMEKDGEFKTEEEQSQELKLEIEPEMHDRHWEWCVSVCLCCNSMSHSCVIY